MYQEMGKAEAAAHLERGRLDACLSVLFALRSSCLSCILDFVLILLISLLG